MPVPTTAPVLGVELECSRATTASWGTDSAIELQVPEATGWHVADRIVPRRGFDKLGGFFANADRVRLVFKADCSVKSLAWAAPPGSGTVSAPTISTPSSCDHADGVSALAEADDSPVYLGAGETISMSFHQVAQA